MRRLSALAVYAAVTLSAACSCARDPGTVSDGEPVLERVSLRPLVAHDPGRHHDGLGL